jgi:hypothetical protein
MGYSADKGEKLLEINTGQVGGMGPPITYQIDGKQYVALMGGTGKVTPRFGAPPPAAAPAAALTSTTGAAAPDLVPPAAPDVPSGPAPKLLVYMLDGKAN